MNINNETLNGSRDVTLLGITIDDQLSFTKQVTIMCRTAANKLSAIKRLNKYLSKVTKMQMVKTFVLSQFNYCPFVWYFCGNGNIHKMEKIQERALRFIENDYTSEYKEILAISNESTLYLKRVRIMAQEVYKSINGLNPKYVQELLVARNSEYSNRRPLDLYVPRVKQITYGYKSYFYEAPSIWNSLPLEIRRAENYNTFKKLVKAWSGLSCRCNYCNTAQEP